MLFLHWCNYHSQHRQFNHRRIMKKNILFLLFLVFSSVALSNFKFPNEAQQGTIFLNIERYKDSGLKSFVTTCKTRLECYKKIQWGIKTGRFVYCKKVTMVINNHIVWGIDFEHNAVWRARQQRKIWGDEDF